MVSNLSFEIELELQKLSTYPMIQLKTSLIAFSLVICFCSNAQSQLSHERTYYVSPEDGKLYWADGNPVYLFISENPDGSKPKRLESESTKDYTNPMFLDTEGPNFVRSKWAIDEEGNYASPQQEIMFEIYNDGTSPISFVVFRGANRYTQGETIFYGQNLEVSARANDELSGVNAIYVSQDGGSYVKYTNKFTPDIDKNFNFKFYSVDNVGNVEEPLSFDFIVDVTSPSSTHLVSGDKSGEVLSPRSSIKLSSVDESSDVNNISFTMDGGDPVVFSDKITLDDLEDGNHTLEFFGTDNVGNRENNKTYNFYLDKTSPVVEASIVGDQYQNRGRVFVSTRTKVKLEASDNKAGVKRIWYKIDGGEEITYREPFELPKSKGNHVIEYYATDNVNNSFKSLFDESKSGRESLDIDMKAPDISFDYIGQEYMTRDTVFITSATEISLSADDDDSGVKNVGYKINGGEGKTYAAPFKIPEEGIFTVDFYGTDQVNNRNQDSFLFIVDNTGPKVEGILSMEPIGSIKLNEMDSSLPVYSAGIKLYLAATDNIIDTDVIYYRLNNGEERVYTQPVIIRDKGINTYSMRAVDKLGNETITDAVSIFIN